MLSGGRLARQSGGGWGRRRVNAVLTLGGLLVLRVPLAFALTALVFVLYLLGLAGLHPMIGAGIVLPVIAAGSFGISHAVLVETGVFAWGLSASISMWSLPIVAASLGFNVAVRSLVTRRDFLFGVAYGLAGVIYLGAVNALSGAT